MDDLSIGNYLEQFPSMTDRMNCTCSTWPCEHADRLMVDVIDSVVRAGEGEFSEIFIPLDFVRKTKTLGKIWYNNYYEPCGQFGGFFPKTMHTRAFNSDAQTCRQALYRALTFAEMDIIDEIDRLTENGKVGMF